MLRQQGHHAIDTVVRGRGGHTVLHDFLHRYRPGGLAIARQCMNDFTLGNETKNRVLAPHHKSANILCAEPVCRTLDAGFRSYCCDVGALAPQNAFDGHTSLLAQFAISCAIDPPPSCAYRRPFAVMQTVSRRAGPLIEHRPRSTRELMVMVVAGANASG